MSNEPKINPRDAAGPRPTRRDVTSARITRSGVKSPLINVMEAAARKAARGLVRDFGEVEQLQVSKKGPADFVSAADLRAERILRTELTKARPRFGFVLEEQGEIRGVDEHNRWVIDPLDGTTNFLHGIPHFAISIAQERDGEVIAAIIYEPVRDEMFWAEKGAGAYLNDRRLRVSARTDLTASLIATGLPFKGRRTHPRYLDTLKAIMERTAGIRRAGSAALDLAYVAAGRYDGFWEYGLSRWDIAAGLLLVREAGGFVTGLDDGSGNGDADPLDTGNVLAANGQLLAPLGAAIREALA
ncbi:MAG: inositol monophosphatase family protein [Candidatus Eiseniibacteriota bacterium]